MIRRKSGETDDTTHCSEDPTDGGDASQLVWTIGKARDEQVPECRERKNAEAANGADGRGDPWNIAATYGLERKTQERKKRNRNTEHQRLHCKKRLMDAGGVHDHEVPCVAPCMALCIWKTLCSACPHALIKAKRRLSVKGNHYAEKCFSCNRWTPTFETGLTAAVYQSSERLVSLNTGSSTFQKLGSSRAPCQTWRISTRRDSSETS